MTVSYQNQVASSTSGGFTRLLLMWKGSIYKLIYKELLVFLVLFNAISAGYRVVMTDTQKRTFESAVLYCDMIINLIPLSFVLGFYVTYVANRWWQQYMAIPWPDKVMHSVALYVIGNDDYGRTLRRSLMRYLNLSLILVLRSISSAVKSRFPTLDHVVDSGFMTSLELELFQSVPSSEFNTYWIPCTWFINLLKEARRGNRLPDTQGLKMIMEEFNEFRSKCGLLWSYDWVSIPLVYTQVVTLATYSYFIVALVGRQYIDNENKKFQMELDKYLPLFTILQFFFFMGLLKVAEQIINPNGSDDEDFELNWLIDRHTKVSYLGVDTLMNRCPPLVKDLYYDSEDLILPYTEAAAAYKKKTYRGSVANMTVPEGKQTMFLPDILEEEGDPKGTITPRTSTASLANHSIESPINNRRQISESPPGTPKAARNNSETIVHLGNQQGLQGNDHPERLSLSDAVKRFSGLSKCSSPRLDNRKMFIPARQSSRVSLQPWPSATNLYNSLNSDTTTEGKTSPTFLKPETVDERTRRLSSQSDLSLEVPTIMGLADDLRRGIINSAFSQERVDFEVGGEESGTSRANQFDVQLRQLADSRHGPPPKFLVRRQRSMGSCRKKKGVRWKSALDGKFRRKTVDCLPRVEIALAQAKSSPDLSAVLGARAFDGDKRLSKEKIASPLESSKL